MLRSTRDQWLMCRPFGDDFNHVLSANLTEFSNGPMLAPRSTEVHVKEATKSLAIAVLMTVADAAIVIWFGSAIWQALSRIIWSRILILLLAALWALSLARIWAHAIYSLQHRPCSWNTGITSSAAITQSELWGEGDV
jgi:purine-cytosine permease-like protein